MLDKSKSLFHTPKWQRIDKFVSLVFGKTVFPISLVNGLYSVWTHEDPFYLSSLIPPDTSTGFRIVFILLSGSVHTLAFYIGWSSAFFSMVHSLIATLVLIEVTQESR